MRTLEKIQKEMKNFDYELVMYVYHTINGRNDEAQGYLDAYYEAQDMMKAETIKVEQNDNICIESKE